MKGEGNTYTEPILQIGTIPLKHQGTPLALKCKDLFIMLYALFYFDLK